MAKPLLTDDLWARIELLFPERPPKPKGGRPPLPDRAVLTGILFVLKTGIPWERLPQEMGCGCGMSCWRRLRDWQQAGVWQKIQEVLLAEIRAADKIDWSRAVIDSASLRAVHGGEKTGPNPTDRGKKGSKHHVIVDAQGLPLGVSLTAANANDITQLFPLVDAIAAIAGHHAVEQKPSKAIGPTIRSSTGERCDADPSERSWPTAARPIVATWVLFAGSWSAHFPGCIYFVACVFA